MCFAPCFSQNAAKSESEREASCSLYPNARRMLMSNAIALLTEARSGLTARRFAYEAHRKRSRSWPFAGTE